MKHMHMHGRCWPATLHAKTPAWLAAKLWKAVRNAAGVFVLHDEDRKGTGRVPCRLLHVHPRDSRTSGHAQALQPQRWPRLGAQLRDLESMCHLSAQKRHRRAANAMHMP